MAAWITEENDGVHGSEPDQRLTVLGERQDSSEPLALVVVVARNEFAPVCPDLPVLVVGEVEDGGVCLLRDAVLESFNDRKSLESLASAPHFLDELGDAQLVALHPEPDGRGCDDDVRRVVEASEELTRDEEVVGRPQLLDRGLADEFVLVLPVNLELRERRFGLRAVGLCGEGCSESQNQNEGRDDGVPQWHLLSDACHGDSIERWLENRARVQVQGGEGGPHPPCLHDDTVSLPDGCQGSGGRTECS